MKADAKELAAEEKMRNRLKYLYGSIELADQNLKEAEKALPAAEATLVEMVRMAERRKMKNERTHLKLNILLKARVT